MRRRANYGRIIKKAKKILSKNITLPPVFYSQKEIIAIFFLAVSLLAATNIKINLAEMQNANSSLVSGMLSAAEIFQDPRSFGIVSGSGTHFEVANSQYLNVTADAADPINLTLESIPEMVIMKIDSAAEVSSTAITLGKLLPSTDFYKYEDDYKNYETIITDDQGKYTYVQDLTKPHLVFIQPRPSTTFIKDNATGGDCVLVGIWDNAAKTCTLTSDIAGTVQIDSDGVTLDGGGKTIFGSNTGSGIYIKQKSNITIRNNNIKGFSMGMYAMSMQDSVIENNILTENGDAFYMQAVKNNKFFGNITKLTTRSGFRLEGFNTGNVITDNDSSNNAYGFRIEGSSNENTVKNNTIASNTYWGIIMWLSSGNTIYNNYFNNTKNFLTDRAGYDNYWNIAKTPGINIVGGQNLGGNFWATPSGTGFSETCADANGDAICDESYNLYYENRDLLPLAVPDKIPPSTTINISGAIGADAWYVSSVEVALTAVDNPSGSGLAKTEYSFDNAVWNAYSLPFSIGTEGEMVIYYRSVDNAGNTEESKRQAIKIDKTPPVASGTVLLPANPYGWYNSEVPVRFSCEDTVSGPVEQYFDMTVSQEGVGQGVEGICTDKAGNASNFIVDGINIDKTPPIVSVFRSPEPNSFGWNNVSVEATFAASDSLSGIDGSPAKVIPFIKEGANQSASHIFKDKAGNSGTGFISGINIDLTPPSIDGSPTFSPNINNWYNSDVTVHFSGSDALSGLVSLSPDIVLASEGANQEASGAAEDKAGNRSVFKASGINIDKTPPQITGKTAAPPNINNWHNKDVVVVFSALDSLSGLYELTPNITISQEGADQSAEGKAVDMAGNSAFFKVLGINIDKRAPFTEAVIAGAGTEICHGGDVEVKLSATDNLSGLANIFYNLNNSLWKTYFGVFNVSSEGNYSLKYKSEDNASNMESEKTAAFAIDKTPSEAIIKFDSTAKDIKVYSSKTGLEAGYMILAKSKMEAGKADEDGERGWQTRKYTLQDCGNNSLELVLEHKKEGKESKVKIINMQYGGGAVLTAPKNKIMAQYSEDKNNSIKELEQGIIIDKKFDIEAKYSAGSNLTKLKIGTEEGKLKKYTEKGMVILELLTSRGELNYNY